MERHRQTSIKPEAWREWLYRQVAENRPLNELLGEILASDGVDENSRAAATFFLDREGESHLLTRDVGRIFLGVDLQCAQCHDHPVIADYYQQDYYGLNAFLNRSSVFTDPQTKQAYVAEKAEGETNFVSVFIDGEKYSAAPHLPGEKPIDEPTFAQGEEYRVKPAKDVRPEPRFSRRAALAEIFAQGQSRQFTRNLANRLWAVMFGRGLVDPVDLNHSDNPPTHPQLLELLTDKLAEMQYDARAFLRELALSGAYQQSHRMPDELLALAPQAEQIVADARAKVSQAEESLAGLSKGSLQLREQISAAEKQLQALEEKEQLSQTMVADAERKLAELIQARDAAAQEAAARDEEAQTVQRLAADAAQVAAKLKDNPLVAETAERLQTHAQQLTAVADEARRQAEQAAAKIPPSEQKAAAARASLAQLAVDRRQTTDRLGSLQNERTSHEIRQAEARRELLAVRAKVQDAELLGEYCQAAADRPDGEQATTAWSRLTQRWSERAFIARLRPLDPEQFGFCVLQATGVLAPRRAAAEKADQDKQGAAGESAPSLSIAVEQAAYKQSERDVQAFLAILSHGEGPAAHEYEATVDEALFLANGRQVGGWLEPRAGSLTERVPQIAEPAAVAEELYLSVLSRLPEDAERAAVVDFLAGRNGEERTAAIQEMIWGLLTSVEFRFNH